ncbi:uncharacterized protein TOL2_C33310 [Desulfobacula toluolica Tol2]|uniref:Uncharacterized protein n=1 Tax=Desulfobacula toluolica (strain DSM 7467 / Tol2) TaxID=651182 RepID=K0NN97_DESTT|nr:uncharacterized protein TOL2_C33310 [Desulfobacula toluolica Tol2]
MQPNCTDINKLTIIKLIRIISWSDKTYYRIPFLSLDKHQANVFKAHGKTGFYMSFCEQLICRCFGQNGKLHESLIS